MAKIVYDKLNLVQALEPGIVSLVVSEFEKRLNDKLNDIIEQVFLELRKELPDKIKAVVLSAINPEDKSFVVDITVDLRG